MKNTKIIKSLTVMLMLIFFIVPNYIAARNMPKLTAITTFAPDVPPPIKRNYPAYVIVNFETIELIKELDNGVKYHFWTFDGSVPGKFVRVK